jgi:hypothetical protein
MNILTHGQTPMKAARLQRLKAFLNSMGAYGIAEAMP